MLAQRWMSLKMSVNPTSWEGGNARTSATAKDARGAKTRSASYVEGVEEDEQRNLYHADLHSNAAPHLQARGRSTRHRQYETRSLISYF